MDHLNQIKASTKICAAAAAVIGLLYMIVPAFTRTLIAIVAAALLIYLGVMKLMAYFKASRNPGLPELDLALGGFLIIAGIIFIIYRGTVSSIAILAMILVMWLVICEIVQRTYDLYRLHAPLQNVGILRGSALLVLIFAILVLCRVGGNVVLGLGVILAAVAAIFCEIWVPMSLNAPQAPAAAPAQPAAPASPSASVEEILNVDAAPADDAPDAADLDDLQK